MESEDESHGYNTNEPKRMKATLDLEQNSNDNHNNDKNNIDHLQVRFCFHEMKNV